jgi:hypothetical protein
VDAAVAEGHKEGAQVLATFTSLHELRNTRFAHPVRSPVLLCLADTSVVHLTLTWPGTTLATESWSCELVQTRRPPWPGLQAQCWAAWAAGGRDFTRFAHWATFTNSAPYLLYFRLR